MDGVFPVQVADEGSICKVPWASREAPSTAQFVALPHLEYLTQKVTFRQKPVSGGSQGGYTHGSYVVGKYKK